MSQCDPCLATNRTDRTGKVFIVNNGTRVCLICQQEFSPRASAEHAKAACYPSVPDMRPIRSRNANR